jgi:hypothetical protein
MNVYEHGIAAESDEWGGSLKPVSSTDLPVHSGFSLTIVDIEGRSVNERAVGLGHVNGPCYAADYFEESDLRYCALAMLYHLSRLIELYVAVTQLFEKLHPPGTATSGNTTDPRVFYELDAFLGAARRLYESMRKVLWKHYGTGRTGRWRSIRTAIESVDIVPAPFAKRLAESWKLFGEMLADYRDCVAHYDPLTDGGTTCWMERYGNRWGMSVKLPANPKQKNRRSFDFANGPEALSYCHTVACHLVDVCEALEALEKVRHHLDSPRPGHSQILGRLGREIRPVFQGFRHRA